MKLRFYSVLFKMSLMILVVACQSNVGEQSESGTSQEAESAMPQIRKIPIENRAEADSLIARGVEVIVIEDDYVAARLKQNDMVTLQTLNLHSEPIEEAELVQRLVKIPVQSKQQVDDLVSLGLDVWQIKGDTVIAQVYDKHILEAEKKGYSIEIVEGDLRDVVKKGN